MCWKGFKVDGCVDFLKQEFAANQSWLLFVDSIISPKLIDDFPFTTNEVSVLGVSRELGKGGNRRVGARLDNCSMSDEGHTL